MQLAWESKISPEEWLATGHAGSDEASLVHFRIRSGFGLEAGLILEIMLCRIPGKRAVAVYLCPRVDADEYLKDALSFFILFLRHPHLLGLELPLLPGDIDRHIPCCGALLVHASM